MIHTLEVAMAIDLTDPIYHGEDAARRYLEDAGGQMARSVRIVA
jgi:hypothetical protein